MAWPVEDAYTEAWEAIRARIVAQWVNGAQYRTAIQFPGTIGVMLVNGTMSTQGKPPVGLPWLKVDLVGVTAQAFSYCKDHGTNRNTVWIYLTVYSPRNDGENQLLSLIGLARVIFSRKHTGDGLRPEVTDIPMRLPDEKECLVAQVKTLCHFYETVQQ